MQLGVFVDGAVDANEEAARLEIGQMILEIEPRAIPQSGAMRSGGLIEHSGSTGIGPRATYHDPNVISYSICAARCITLLAPRAHCAANAVANFGFKRGTRNIKLLVVLRFRSWYLNVLRVLTNFGIGPLASPASFLNPRAAADPHGHPDDAND